MNENFKISNLEKILNFLNEDKNEIIRDLNRIKMYLEKKIHSVNCLLQYKSGYNTKDDQFKSCIPALMQNKQKFIRKLDDAIETESKQIEMLECEKIGILGKLEAIDIKIKAIESQISDFKNRLKINEEEVSASEQSDLAINSHIKDKL